MHKRSRDNERTPSPAPKRLRATADRTDRLSSLSDELLIQILSFLPIPSLITCQRYCSLYPWFLGGDVVLC